MIYLRVLLIRRLPGGIWHWVDRTAMYKGTTNISGKVVMQANFLEWSLLGLLAIAIWIATIQGGLVWLRWLLFGTLISLAVYLAYAWQSRKRSRLSRLLESCLWLGLYSLVYIAGGLILYLYCVTTQASLPENSIFQTITFMQSVGTWAISAGISQLVIIIPGGLGIREIALTRMLNGVLPFSSIMLVSILIRLTYALADALWGSLSMILSLSLFKSDRWRNRRENK